MVEKTTKTASRLKKSLFKKDPSHRTHFLHSSTLGTDSQRFQRYQSALFSHGLGSLPASTLLLGCLLGFDGVANETALELAYSSCLSAASWAGAIRIDWYDQVRCNARNLSDITILALSRVEKGAASYAEAKPSLQDFLAKHSYAGLPDGDPSALWNLLLLDALAWLQTELPPVLFGHVSSVECLSALPRSALAREQRKLALMPEDLQTPFQSVSSQAPYERAFEAAMLGRSPSMMSGGLFLKKLIQALAPSGKGSAASQRALILTNLRLLAAGIEEADQVNALIYVFSLDLLERGTRRKAKLAPGTPRDYVASFAQDFHAKLTGLNLLSIDTESYAGIYRELLGETPPSYKVAALKAFHIFLRSWWQVPKLPAEIFQIDIDTAVSANVVWPHELELLKRWFEESEPSRFKQQIRTGLAIAGNAMIRIGELRVLRCRNVVDEGDHIVIEIAREIRDGKEKTESGRRRITIKDPAAVLHIRAWAARRRDEDAATGDYLFGDPANPTEICDAGKMHFWMIRLLKSVTGDETVRLHTLRHSVATFRFQVLLIDDREYEVNPMDGLANEGGHIGGHITAVNYCHLFEAGLRHWLDVAIGRGTFEYADVQEWTRISQATLRQRVSRPAGREMSRAGVLLQAIKQCANQVSFPLISTPVVLTEPANPLLALKPKDLTYQQTLGVLGDIASGLSSKQAAMRRDVDNAVVDKAIKVVGAFADSHGKPELELSDFLVFGTKALRDSMGRLLGLRPDFARLNQSRWRLLAQAIDHINQATLFEAVQYWQRTLSGVHLPVRPGPGWEQMVELIKHSEINAGLLALKYSASPGEEARISGTLALAQATFRLKLGRSVSQRPQKPRHGRPDIWLVIGPDRESLAKEKSGISMAGFHCALLAAAVWLTLIGEKQEETK